MEPRPGGSTLAERLSPPFWRDRLLILGIHREPYHNTGAAALLDDGEEVKVVAISEERLDRVKDSASYPDKSIEYCLSALGAKSVNDCDLIVSDYIHKPEWDKDRPNGIRNALAVFKKSTAGTRIKHKISGDRVAFVNHHIAHACSAFYASGYEDAAVLIVDGHGTALTQDSLDTSLQKSTGFETQSLYRMRKGEIELLDQTGAPGAGMLYAAFTQFLGFGLLQEGKTMGLAPYGDGLAEQHVDFPLRFSGVQTDYSELVDIWADEGKWVKQKNLRPCKDSEKQTSDYYARISWEVQNELERAMVHLTEIAQQKTGCSHLCIAGGVGLNSVANYQILRRKIFDEIWVQPASSDTGIPLGCALYGYYHLSGGTRPWKMDKAYMGRTYGPSEITAAVEKYLNKVEVIQDTDYLTAAQLLADGKIVGWFHGGSEYGPRSLGHRSILVDPRNAESKDILNARVKHREGFRPFAPSVLLDRVSEFFDLETPSPYMLLVAPVRPDKRDVIPAVNHVDNTARVQTVSRMENGLFYDLIEAFGKLTGVPVLLNTSFNVAGEPIVETPEDAIKCFLGTEIDVLILDRVLLKKRH